MPLPPAKIDTLRGTRVTSSDSDSTDTGPKPSHDAAIKDLPPVVSHAITRAVREHGTDTADLLRHVYLTPPMLAARPGDRLDFSTAASVVRETQTPHAPARLTVKEKRRRAAIIDSARAEVRQRLAKSRSKRAAPQRAPRYDAVFREGTAQLDRLAGDPIVRATGEITFDDSVWHASN